jgi:hypothetical protein
MQVVEYLVFGAVRMGLSGRDEFRETWAVCHAQEKCFLLPMNNWAFSTALRKPIAIQRVNDAESESLTRAAIFFKN